MVDSESGTALQTREQTLFTQNKTADTHSEQRAKAQHCSSLSEQKPKEKSTRRQLVYPYNDANSAKSADHGQLIPA